VLLEERSIEEFRTNGALSQELNLTGSNAGRELEGLLPQFSSADPAVYERSSTTRS
jgi:hypothetical protein